MSKRKSKLLVELGFLSKPAENGVPETYKCPCGDMKKFVEYQPALNHSYRCASCKQKRARLPSSSSAAPAGE